MVENLGYGGHGDGSRVTDVDWVYISIVVGVHVPIWEQAIGKERKEDEFGERKKLVSGQSESRASANMVSFQVS